MDDQLTALDATFLELEQMDEGATMHIGGVMVFDPRPDGSAPTVEEVRTNIAARLVRVERYSQRLSAQRTGGLAWPRWEPDPHFDIANHVRRAALPGAGADEELCEWAGDFFSHRLDRTRPLWEMVLVEGLEGGRWALAHKTHHSMVDGVGSVGVAYLLLDGAADAPTPPVVRTGAASPPHTARAAPAEAVVDLARTGITAAGAAMRAALHPREAFDRARSLAEVLVRDELIPAPRTSLNVPIGATRRFDVVRIPLEDLKRAGHDLGCSVNDVVLAACSAGLRDLLESRGETPPREGVRAMVPVNLRSASDQLALGNRITSLFVDLPVAEADVARSLQVISRRTRGLKSSRAGKGAAAMIDLAALAPPVLHSLLARELYATRLFNVTITNVPGPQEPLYALGSPLREIHPLVPLAAHHAVGIAIFSYNGGVVVGISADRDSTPDVDVLARGIERAFHEICARSLGGGHAKTAKKKRPARSGAREVGCSQPATAEPTGSPRRS